MAVNPYCLRQLTWQKSDFEISNLIKSQLLANLLVTVRLPAPACCRGLLVTLAPRRSF